MAEDRILEALGRALETAGRPPTGGPSSERVDALRRSVAARADGLARPVSPLTRDATARRRRWLLVVAGAAAALAVFLTGLVVGHELPRPVRELAHTIGLPVDSPELVDTRSAVDRLGRALAEATVAGLEGEPTEAQFDAVADADAEMLQTVGQLDDDERAAIVPVAHQVHLRAVALFLDFGRELPTAKPSDVEELGRD